MSRLMSLVWTVQFVIFLAAGVASLVKPEWMIYLLEDCRVAEESTLCCPFPVAGSGELDGEVPAAGGPEMCFPQNGLCMPEPPPGAQAAPCGPPCPAACSLVESSREVEALYALARMVSPFYLVFALFSAHAVMREDERTRRNLAFIFAGIFMMLGALVYTDGFHDKGVSKPAFLFGALVAALAALVLFSLYSLVRAEDSSRRMAAVLAAVGYTLLLVGGLYVYRQLLRHVGGSAEELAFHRTKHGADAAFTLLYRLYDLLPYAALVAVVVDTIAGDLERTRARVYAVTLIAPLILTVFDLTGRTAFGYVPSNALSDEPTIVKVMLALIALNIVLHAQYAAWPVEEAEQKLSGSANTRPPSLWVLWLCQGIVLCGFGGFLIWAHGRGASLFIRDNIAASLALPSSGYAPLFDALDELFPALFIALGFFSFSGMHTSREWVWKAHCMIFAIFYGATFLCVLFVWSPTAFSHGFMWFLLPTAILCAAHYAYQRSHQEWFSEDVGEGPDGWILADLWLGPLLMLKSLIGRRRASHARGVAAEGRMTTFAPTAQLPEHEFFHPGGKARSGHGVSLPPGPAEDLPAPASTMDPAALRASIRVQIRFANERTTDDAGADARGAALCMVTPDGKRFDLTMSTGAFAAAENIVEFAAIQVLQTTALGRRMLLRSRRFLEGGLAALRRAPDSYSRLRYHSQSVRFWVSSDGRRNLVRYRLTPDIPASEESGLPVTAADYVQRGRQKGERRPSDYLRRELKLRLQGKQPIRLLLQAQFHELKPGDGLAWYNPAADWHVGTHPWLDLGEITLDSVLSDEASEKLTFNTDKAPSSLGIPVSQGIFDPRSIADSERRVMKRVQALRTWLVSVLGLPREIPKPVS